tara:strand:- start:698 stop:1564 length:867 start_codon:yes stop_codon:yes gene_type:complete
MLKNMKKILLVGADSRLSQEFINRYSNKYKIFGTSRRGDSKFIFLDLINIKNLKKIPYVDFVIFIGGAISYDVCENNFSYAKKINCINIPILAERFLKLKSHVIFVSTNTVFKSSKTIPGENTKTSPGFKYAILKDIAEKKFLKLKNKYKKQISILRLTKNINKKTEPFNSWIKNLKKNKNITAFKDLYFAPILYSDSAKILNKIIENKAIGVFHLSGEKDINYCDFAKKLILRSKKKITFVNCQNSNDLKIKLVYNHHITALKMRYTFKKLGVKPVKLSKIINYILK